jgi:transcriptional regulator with XRE-family HTH domain
VSLAEDVRAEIRTALHDTRTSQAELSRRLGLSTKHVSRVLTGRAALSLELAEAMLAALGRQMTVRAREIKGAVRK